MKIAYTINGLMGSIDGKNFENKNADHVNILAKYVYKSIDSRILKNNDVDIFLFSWHDKEGEHIDNIFKPKKSIHTEQIKFTDLPAWLDKDPGHRPRVQAHISRWYGFKEVMKLRKQYEQETGTKYDLVVNARFDHYWEKDIDFSTFDTNQIHLSNFTCTTWGWPSNVAPNELFGDLFVMKPKYIDNLAGMFDLLYEYTAPGNCTQYKTISHHFLTKYHFEKQGWLTKDKINFSLKSCSAEDWRQFRGSSHHKHVEGRHPDYYILRHKLYFEKKTLEDIK